MKQRFLGRLLGWGLAVVLGLVVLSSCAQIAKLLEGTEKEEDEEAKKKEQTDMQTQFDALGGTDAAARKAAVVKLRELTPKLTDMAENPAKPKSIEALIRAAADPDVSVALEAVRTLGTFSYLPELDEDEREIDPEARQAAENLKEATDRRALSALLKAARHSNPDVRYWAVWGLQNMADPQPDPTLKEQLVARATPVLQERLRDENRDVQVLAINALVVLQAEEAIPAIAALLKADKDVHVRRRAATALGELNARGEVPTLIRALERDEDEDVKWRAAQALARLADPASVEALAKVVAGSSNPAARLFAIYGLSRIDSPETRAVLANLNQAERLAADKAIEEMEAKRKKRF